MKKQHINYNVLVIDDQPSALEIFSRRFTNYRIEVENNVYEVRYYFQSVTLKQTEKDGKWSFSDDTLDDICKKINNTNFNLILIDYAFVPPEKDEELTYKLNHYEIKTEEELLGAYVLDASELFANLINKHRNIKRILQDKNIRFLMYTYPADSLMHLLGDADQRMNKLSRVLKRDIDVLDTRQLLYGGNKELELHHNRKLYPQLLSGYLNFLVLIYLQREIQEIIPLYKKIKIKKSIFSVTTIAAFAGGVALTSDFLVSNASLLWTSNKSLAILLIFLVIFFCFLSGSLFAIFFEKLVRNLIKWVEN